jgi:hypothetical protein
MGGRLVRATDGKEKAPPGEAGPRVPSVLRSAPGESAVVCNEAAF